MKMRYDEESDALYLRLDDAKVVDSQEVRPGIVLDFNAENEVIGIEVLQLKRRVPNVDPKKVQFEVA